MASFQVTLYGLFLGDQDGVTGWFRPGYVIKYAKVAVVPKGTISSLTGVGFYSRHNAEGITAYEVKVGDTIKNSAGVHYLVAGRQPYRWGDMFAYYALDLEEIHDFPFLSGFFGFEDTEHGLMGYGFEDGFERGYWAL